MYAGVAADHLEWSPYCRLMMFHDTLDGDVYHRDQRLGGPGGVPFFWARLQQQVGRERTVDFTSQPATWPATRFGIGVLLPG